MPDRPDSSRSGDGKKSPRLKRRPAPAGRRSVTTERGRRTRERILRAATELFSTRGYTATRVDDILRASGTGKSQFYHYFEHKADLGRAVLRHQRALSMPRGDTSLGHLDTWERIAAWFDEILRSAPRADRHGTLATDAFSLDAPDVTPPLRREYLRTIQLRRRLLSRGLRRMHRRGSLAADVDPDRLAAFAAAAIEGGLRIARAEGSVEPLRHALGEAYAHLRSRGS